MKKLIYIPAAVGILALGGVAWANTDANPQDSNVQAESAPDVKADAPQSTNQPKSLTFDEASEKALQEVDGKIADIELERDGSAPYFEVDIDKDGYEYDLKLDAVTGEILEQKREKDDSDENDDDGDDNFTSAEKSSSATVSANGYISRDEAVAAAKTVASGTVEDMELDDDDGVAYYEIELQDGRTEHEVHVNAKDGSILKHETGKDDDDDNRDDNDDDDEKDDDDDDERDD